MNGNGNSIDIKTKAKAPIIAISATRLMVETFLSTV